MTALSYLYVIVGLAFFVIAAVVTSMATETGGLRPAVSAVGPSLIHLGRPVFTLALEPKRNW